MYYKNSLKSKNKDYFYNEILKIQFEPNRVTIMKYTK